MDNTVDELVIFVRLQDGKCEELPPLREDSKVKDLQELIETKLDVPVSQQKIIFRGKYLADPNVDLHSHEIGSDTTIELQIIPRQKLSVFVRLPDKSCLSVEIYSDETVAQLKRKICTSFEHEKWEHEIYFQRKLLMNDSATMRDLSVVDSKMFVVQRTPKSEPHSSSAIHQSKREDSSLTQILPISNMVPQINNKTGSINQPITTNSMAENKLQIGQPQENLSTKPCIDQHGADQNSHSSVQLDSDIFHERREPTHFEFDNSNILFTQQKGQQSQNNVTETSQIVPDDRLTMSNILKVSIVDSDSPSCKTSLCQMIQEILTYNYVSAFKLNEDNENVSISYNELDIPTTEMNNDESNVIHPMDMLIQIFNKSDDYLRQTIIKKLAQCQIAVPFILPPKDYSSPTPPEVLIWAMESIKVCFQQQKDIIRDEVISQLVSKAVLFVRCGNTKNLSKSKVASSLLNEDNQLHFLNRQHFRKSKKKLTNGLLDVSWYLPRGNRSIDSYSSHWIALNLHGSMMTDHGMTVIQCVCQTFCQILCIFIGEDCEPNVSMETLVAAINDVQENVKLIIWICTSGSRSRQASEFKSAIRKQSHLLSKSTMITFPDVMESEVIRRIHSHIEGSLSKEFGTFSISTLADNCKLSQRFVLDKEREPICNIIYLTKNLSKKLPPGLKKSEYLYLQFLVKEYLLKKKDCLRSSCDSKMEQLNRITTYWKNQFKAVLEKFFSSEETFFMYFINLLFEMNSSDNLCTFLTQIERLFNQRNFTELPSLRKRFNEMEEILKAQMDVESRAKYQDEIDRCRQEIMLKHSSSDCLLREASLVAEGLDESNSFLSNYMDTAIGMLRNGFPVELMDGHSSNVNIHWLRRLFHRLKEQICDRVCVLSILGLQSTGKSTLLNSMFGLNLDVSVARCTRGISAQLLPLSKELEERINCSHILVLDTEGLCSKEQRTTREDDNDLATFVVSLSNTTIINIRGENLAEIQDILQIVAVALLRMKCAYADSIQLFKPSCVLVHQNIDALDAPAKLEENRISVKNCLDEAALIATKIVNNSYFQVNSFSDIINFDISNPQHVWYIPSLWKGSVPMATVNPAYALKTQELKASIFNILENIKDDFIFIEELFDKMKSIWECMLQNDFLFSIQNSLDSIGYQILEKSLNLWELKLIQIYENSKNHVREIVGDDDVDESMLQKHFRKMFKTRCKEIINHEIETLFSASEYKALLQPHRNSSEKTISDLFEKLAEEGKVYLSHSLSRQKFWKMVKTDYHHFQDTLIVRAKELSSNGDLQFVFSTLWMAFINDINEKCVEYKYQWLTEFLRSIEEQFSSHKDIVDVVKIHLSQERGDLEYLIDVASHRSIKTVEERVEYELSDFQRTGASNDPTKVKTFFNSLCSTINVDGVNIPVMGKAYLLIRTFQMASPIIQQDDPLSWLNSQRINCFNEFKILIAESSCASRISKLLAEVVKQGIDNYLDPFGSSLLSDWLQANCKGQIPQSRRQLIGHCLYNIGSSLKSKQGNINLLICFIDNCEKMLQHTMKLIFIQICERQKAHIHEYFKQLVHSWVDNVLQSLKESFMNQGESIFVSSWLDGLFGKVSFISRTSWPSLKQSVSVSESVRTSTLQYECLKYCETLKEHFFSQSLPEWIRTSFNQMRSTGLLSGCQQKCPFCNALCVLSNSHSFKHEASVHLPIGFCGYTVGFYPRKFIYKTCPQLVASKMTFDHHSKSVRYRDYGSVHKNWFIPANDKHGTPIYWMWLMTNFKVEIEQIYNAKLDVPHDWSKYSWSQAVESLEQLCNVSGLQSTTPINYYMIGSYI